MVKTVLQTKINLAILKPAVRSLYIAVRAGKKPMGFRCLRLAVGRFRRYECRTLDF